MSQKETKKNMFKTTLISPTAGIFLRIYMFQASTILGKWTHGREGSVGSLVAVCKARCGRAVDDTFKFVEPHNILQKILVCLGILFLTNSRR